MATTLLPAQLTPCHADVVGPVHTTPELGCEPEHSQLLYARTDEADRAADNAHIALSCDTNAVGCNDGALLGPPHTGVLPNLPTVDVSFVKQFA